MVESPDAGEVQQRFFIIIWTCGFKVKSYLYGWVVGCRRSPGEVFHNNMVIWF